MTELNLQREYLSTHESQVRPEWIDHNNHMNLTSYPIAFYEAVNAFSAYLGMSREFKTRTKTASFLADMHLSYKRELFADAPIVIYSRVINFDRKRIHAWHEMYQSDEGYLAATCEMLSLNIDTDTRRVAPMPDDLLSRLAVTREQHNQVPRPSSISSAISIGDRSAAS